MIAALANLLVESDDSQTVAIRQNAPITFAQFRHDIAAAAGKFAGCRAGALLCRDSYHFAVGFFGLMHARARVLLPPQSQPASLKTLSDEYDILVDDSVVEGLQATPRELQPLDPDTHLIDVYTSGSTGLPQKIGKNLACLDAEISRLEEMWGSEIGNGPVYATVSHQHIYGLTFKILWPLCRGRPFIAEQYALWEDLTAALTSHAILISSPAHLSRLEGLPALAENKKLRAIFTAGAPLATAAAQQAETLLGCAPREIFGSTETGAIATRLPAIQGSWHALPCVDIKIDDTHQLHVRSPFTGNTWIATRDRVEATPGGFRFLGRADTIVKIEGKRVSLAAVETRLHEMDEIKDAAAVMLPRSPELLAAAVTLSEGGKALLAQMGVFRMNRHLRRQLLATEDAASVPRLWRFIDVLPLQAMGKRRAEDIISLFDEAS